MSIDSFVGVFQGGARPNMFRVQISGAGGGYLGAGMAQFQFLCKGASLPGRTIEQVEVPYMNRKVPYAGDPTNSDFSITVINDSNFLIRNGFENWQSAIQNRGLITGLTVPQTYFGTAEVIQLDRSGAPLKTYRLFNVWPSNVQEIALDFGTNNSVEEYTVNLKYSHFEA